MYNKNSTEIDKKFGFDRKFKDVEPTKLINLLPEDKYEYLINHLKNILNNKTYNYEEDMYRKVADSSVLNEIAEYLIPTARKIFNSDTLVCSYTLWSEYDNPKSNLLHHIDSNACTYTIDMCVYQDNEWPLWVENKEYHLEPNTALCYYGEDQVHWRDEFNKDGVVAMIFFHFVEPDHWWFNKDEDWYKNVHGPRCWEHQKALGLF
jgi:hypothetical protein